MSHAPGAGLKQELGLVVGPPPITEMPVVACIGAVCISVGGLGAMQGAVVHADGCTAVNCKPKK